MHSLHSDHQIWVTFYNRCEQSSRKWDMSSNVERVMTACSLWEDTAVSVVLCVCLSAVCAGAHREVFTWLQGHVPAPVKSLKPLPFGTHIYVQFRTYVSSGITMKSSVYVVNLSMLTCCLTCTLASSLWTCWTHTLDLVWSLLSGWTEVKKKKTMLKSKRSANISMTSTNMQIFWMTNANTIANKVCSNDCGLSVCAHRPTFKSCVHVYVQ